MSLDGISINEFRSFGEIRQYAAPLSRLNVFAGTNNSGKSNVLRFAEQMLGPLAGRSVYGATITPPTGMDVPLGRSGATPTIGLALPKVAAIGAIEEAAGGLDGDQRAVLEETFDAPSFRHTQDDLAWFDFDLERLDESRTRLKASESQRNAALEGRPQRIQAVLGGLSNRLTQTQGGALGDDLDRILSRCLDSQLRVPTVVKVEAIRQVTEGAEDFAGYSGAGLIKGLARLQDPSVADQSKRERFEAINRFLGVVLEDPTAQLRIPYERNTINVQLGSTILPIENMGTGVHEVIIIAAAASLHDESLLCVEEPEIHLHPTLQRALLRYLATETTNQYLIASHSAALLDSTVTSIFKVTAGDNGSNVRKLAAPNDIARLALELGYRASDIVQANAVVWVEGPSDRLYVRHWIGLVDPSLVEGVHYSVMFYGGSLLKHLSADDPEVQDFIALRRLNRNSAIVMDSDTTRAQARLGEAKTRIRDEFQDATGAAWVTAGYTIENYVPFTLLQPAFRTTHPRSTISQAARYENPFAPAKLERAPAKVDKVGVARRVVQAWSDVLPMPLDLRARISDLTAFIREAN